MPTFGETLKKLREASGKSQTELAEELKLSPWTLRNHEQDRRVMSAELVFQYCKALGASCSEFEDAKAVNKPQPKKNDTKPKPKKKDM